jgi:hypothetical protein
MTAGDVEVRIVESPITTAKIDTAVGEIVSATSNTVPISLTSFNQGRSILIVGIDTD